MTVVAEVSVSTRSVAMAETLTAAPETVVEIERVVAHSAGTLTPYFWVDGDLSVFEDAVEDDPTIDETKRLDELDGQGLYRAEWPGSVESVAHAAVETGGTIVEATGQRGGWELQLRFENPEQLPSFSRYCSKNGVEYDVQRVYRLSNAELSVQFGVTEKQREALITAYEAGYYQVPREETMDSVADEVGVSQQALSKRLRRGHGNLVSNLLTAEGSDVYDPARDL